MKKLLIKLGIGCLTVVLAENAALAQQPGDMAMLSEGKPYFKSFHVREDASVSNVNRKALKDFSGRYIGATSLNWYAVKGGFMNYFTAGGFPDRAFYDTHGRWQYSLIFYREDSLPRDIRGLVKSTYYDYAITLVQEVQTAESRCFVVYLEDAKTIRMVQVSPDGELQTRETFEKQ